MERPALPDRLYDIKINKLYQFLMLPSMELINEILGIEIIREDIGHLKERIFYISLKHSRSAYDAAYIAVAESDNLPFLTADKKLFNSLKHHFPFVNWIEDYPHAPD